MLMSLFSTLFGITAAFAFIACILYVIFGQVTVRKLRNDPETRDKLGFEFVSGWNIIKVAQALSLPRFMTDKFKQSPISSLYANTDILNTHTSKIDKAFAYTFYWFFMGSNLFGICVLLLNAFGVFD